MKSVIFNSEQSVFKTNRVMNELLYQRMGPCAATSRRMKPFVLSFSVCIIAINFPFFVLCASFQFTGNLSSCCSGRNRNSLCWIAFAWTHAFPSAKDWTRVARSDGSIHILWNKWHPSTHSALTSVSSISVCKCESSSAGHHSVYLGLRSSCLPSFQLLFTRERPQVSQPLAPQYPPSCLPLVARQRPEENETPRGAAVSVAIATAWTIQVQVREKSCFFPQFCPLLTSLPYFPVLSCSSLSFPLPLCQLSTFLPPFPSHHLLFHFSVMLIAERELEKGWGRIDLHTLISS